ncbi:MAG: SIS domain-containing protein [Tannerella sp.]|jgi:arabinose-5-phosphate isomerase|nr:SIS domain-containing protein [Tannerella sp.]
MIDYFERQMRIIYGSFEKVQQTEFDRLTAVCTGTKKDGGKIIASGLGKNVPICEKFVGTMNSLGLDARFLHTNTAIHGDLGMITPRDTVLLLSKSGNTWESVLLAEQLCARKTETWLLSFAKESRLATMLKNQLILELDHEGDQWNIVPNCSTAIYLILLQGLAMRIAESAGVQLCDFRANHPGGGIGEILRRR